MSITAPDDDIDRYRDDEDEYPVSIAPPDTSKTPALSLRGVNVPADEAAPATTTPAAPVAAAPPKPATDPALTARRAADEGEAARLGKTGSGIDQVMHGSPEGGIGIAKPHRILGGFLRGLDVLGSVVAPGITANIPGTSLHHSMLTNQANRRIGTDIAQEGEEARAGQTAAQTAETNADTALKQKQLEDAGKPKPKEEEWSVIPGMIGPNGQPVQQEKNSGQIRFAPGITGVGPSKPPTDNATAEDQKYEDIQARASQKKPVSADETAWAKAYEKRKNLGPAFSAGAANTRQDKTEDFQREEKGREHITKVEGDYQDAATKADLIRDAIKQAQSGNKMAGAFQGMLATLGITTMEGVKRINAVELGIPTGAGSIWDRVQGELGKWTVGQPMDADLQKDLIGLADTIQAASYKKYKTQHDSIVKRYGLTDEEAIAGPTGTQVNAPTVGTIEGGYRFKGGNPSDPNSWEKVTK